MTNEDRQIMQMYALCSPATLQEMITSLDQHEGVAREHAINLSTLDHPDADAAYQEWVDTQRMLQLAHTVRNRKALRLEVPR